ncbi:MAG: SDR family NAD(P)-dependent oxidoreductase, partial [Rhodobacteraceae bacterium]|nr:SDR family NAD(P)-dependent oxidoreductase [Paracoccaceae bacterium]
CGQMVFADRLSDIRLHEDMTRLVLFIDMQGPDCFSELLSHLQAAVQVARGKRLLVTIAHAPDGAEGWSALLQGPRLVVPAEHPNLTLRTLELSPQSSIEALRAALVALQEESGCFALRGPYLWRKHLVPVAAPAAPVADAFAAGTHLVLGGTGGIGQHLVGALAAAAPSRIILVSRSIGEGSLTDCAARMMGGSEIYQLRADIADPMAMKALAAGIKARFGQLASVYHCAGVAGSGLLMQHDTADFAHHVRTTLNGLDNIETVLMPLAPERIVLAASMSAQFGVAGQSDYSAGHAFATQWAERMAADYPAVQVTAICWPTWAETGLAAGLGPMSETLADYAVTPSEGIALLKRVLALGLPAVQVCPVPPAAVEKALGERARPTSRAGGQEQACSVQEAFCRVLGIDRLGEEEDFFDHGGDSLSALDLLDLLQVIAPAPLHLSDVMQNPTGGGIKRLLAGAEHAPVGSTLLPIRSGQRAQVVCVAPIGGDISGYRDISVRLADGIGLLALRDPVFLGERQQSRSVADLAARYLADLDGMVPKVLVGWSFGAMVAFQIASDLQHAGRTVPKLGLIDPPAIGHHASDGLPLETVVAHELASLGASRSPDQEPGFRDSMALA